MNDTTKWEERFENKIQRGSQPRKHTGSGTSPYIPLTDLAADVLITFIRNELSSQKQAVVEMIESKKNNVVKNGSSCLINGIIDDESAGGGYLQALDDILNAVKEI